MTLLLEPPPTRDEELTAGLIAFDEIQSYRRATAARKREPFGILGVIFFFVVSISCLAFHLKIEGSMIIPALGSLFCIFYLGFHLRAQAKARYLKNVETVRSLEAKYGSAVPWREIERQQLAIAEIQHAAAHDSVNPAGSSRAEQAGTLL